MASAEQIKALLKSHIEGDNSHFFSVAMQVAAHEAKLGHGKLARELRAIIDEAKKKRYAVPSLKPMRKISGFGRPCASLPAELVSIPYKLPISTVPPSL